MAIMSVMLLIIGTYNWALAGRSGKQSGGGEGPWVVDSSAKGTKLPVTIGIHYELAENVEQPGICGADDFEVKMTFFLRLSTNKNAFPWEAM